jgi:hypothetical protein
MMSFWRLVWIDGSEYSFVLDGVALLMIVLCGVGIVAFEGFS